MIFEMNIFGTSDSDSDCQYHYDIVKYTERRSFLCFRWIEVYYHLRRHRIESRGVFTQIYDKVDGGIFMCSKYHPTSKIKTYDEALKILENIQNEIDYNCEIVYSTNTTLYDPLEERFEELENSVPKNVPKLVNGNLKWSMND
jgi:hypothetical protein